MGLSSYLVALLLLELISSSSSSLSSSFFQTESGYDTQQGRDAICWHNHALLRSCSEGNFLQAVAPADQSADHLRTGTSYTYHADVSLNLTSWDLNANNISTVSASVIACRVGQSGGLCSPFVVPQEEVVAQDKPPPVLQSQKVIQELPEFEKDHDAYTFQMDLPLLVDSPGEFVVVISLEIGNNTQIYMANALQSSALVSYQAPAQILTVSQGVRIAGCIAVALAGGLIVWLLLQTLRHRNHVALRMAQGRFLAVWLFAGLSTVVCSLLLEPRSDTYCRLGRPLLVINLQLFYAITVGRVWRIHSVISPTILQAMSHMQHDNPRTMKWTQRFCFDVLHQYTACILKCENRTRPKRLRKAFSERQLAVVVVVFWLPQVLLQILGALYQPWQLAVEWNDDQSMGRQYCNLPEDLSFGTSVFYYGIILFVLLLLMLFIMARAARGLPSLFNESKIIFDSLLSSIFLLILGLGVIYGTSSPTTSPSVPFAIALVIILFVILQSSLRLVIPKLKMAWRNETIVVSDLMAEHATKVREKQARRSGTCLRRQGSTRDFSQGSGSHLFDETLDGLQGNHVHITGLDYPSPCPMRRNCSTSSASLGVASLGEAGKEEKKQEGRKDVNNKETTGGASGSLQLSFCNTDCPSPPDSRPNSPPEDSRAVVRFSIPNATTPTTRRRKNPHLYQAPLKAVLKALELQNRLTQVQKNVVTGLQVDGQEWDNVRELAREMEQLFAENDKDMQSAEQQHQQQAIDKAGDIDGGDKCNNNCDMDCTEHTVITRTGRKYLRQQPGNKLLDPETVVATLGDGPMRFANPRRSVHVQVSCLFRDDQESYRLLRSDMLEDEKENCRRSDSILSGEMILRFLRHCPEKQQDAKHRQLATWRAMKRFDRRNLSLTAKSLEEQLLTKTLFPIPGLKTLQGGNSMFYMRPCRYDPNEMATQHIIDNLVYCMQTMLEDEDASTYGIGFVACMDDWTMKHFSADYCFQFMQALQGHTTPVRVTHFLIVNPPTWFGKVWQIMKTMLSAEFQKKVHMIPECELSDFLAPGFEELLPDDMATGEASTDDMVQDWVTYRKFIEGDQPMSTRSAYFTVDTQQSGRNPLERTFTG